MNTKPLHVLGDVALVIDKSTVPVCVLLDPALKNQLRFVGVVVRAYVEKYVVLWVVIPLKCL